MDKMLGMANSEGIIVKFHKFADPIKGIYWVETDMPPVIGLDISLPKDTPLLRCVMAEELGHHFTTVGDCLPRQFYHHSMSRIHICKAEIKALRWAAQYLLPFETLLKAIENGIVHTWELADYFSVTEWMIRFRARLPDMQKMRSRSNQPECD